MKSGLKFLCVFFCLFLIGCTPSPNRVQTIEGYQYSSDGSHIAVVDPDTVTFEHEVRGVLAMPESEQEVVREEAKNVLKDWESFEWEATERHDARYRTWFHDPADSWHHSYLGVGLGNGILALKTAAAIDPAYAEVWSDLGHLSLQVGDWQSALEHLDRARVAADVRRAFDRPVDREYQLVIYRNRAWVLRDLGRWEEGLEAVQEGLEFRPGDHDLVLIKGLLLAGAGRYEEAMTVALRMKPYRFPLFNLFNRGLKYQKSAYANNWIRSQALLAKGDYHGAFRILGDLKRYSYISLFTHSDRYWRDVGLAAELVGNEKAGLYYAIGHITRSYWGYFPLQSESLGPLVLDVPNPRAPVFTSFGRRFYAGGSYLTYIAIQMNRMALATFPAKKQDAAGRALHALEIAERRNLRPDVCRAMRGRIYYYNDDFQGARTELLAARTAFLEKNTVDSGTSLLLGLLEMQGGRHQGAARFLEEAVGADPKLAVGWRSLGVVYDHLGLPDKAIAAMDMALEVDPYSVSGLYNRGIFHLQHGNQSAAAKDLQLARRFDPENREVQRMLLLTGGEFPTAEGAAVAGVDSLLDASGSPEAILAGLQDDVLQYFAVPDSHGVNVDELEAVIRDLQYRYVNEPDPGTRKILALAYIDNKQFLEAQLLLAPGWGMDLEPDEEVMLLYVDHMLNERERARDLAAALVNGQASGENPYALALTAMIIRDDPRGGGSLVNERFKAYMHYGSARAPWTSSFGYTRMMMMGHSTIRGTWTHDPDVNLPMPAGSEPFFRALNTSIESTASVNAGVPTAGSNK